jgi:hypothetical protein
LGAQKIVCEVDYTVGPGLVGQTGIRINTESHSDLHGLKVKALGEAEAHHRRLLCFLRSIEEEKAHPANSCVTKHLASATHILGTEALSDPRKDLGVSAFKTQRHLSAACQGHGLEESGIGPAGVKYSPPFEFKVCFNEAVAELSSVVWRQVEGVVHEEDPSKAGVPPPGKLFHHNIDSSPYLLSFSL